MFVLRLRTFVAFLHITMILLLLFEWSLIAFLQMKIPLIIKRGRIESSVQAHFMDTLRPIDI